MKLAIVSTMRGVDWGGSEELWADLAREALAAGHEVAVFLHRPAGPAPRRVAELQAAGAHAHFRRAPLRGRLHRVPPLYRLYAKAARPFAPLLRFAPDVAFFSLGDTPSSLHLVDAGLVDRLSAAGVPYACVSHLNVDAGAYGDAARPQLLDFFRGAYRAGFVSDENRLTLCRQLADPLPNAVVLRNPVNLADRSYVPWPAGGPTFASTARLTTVHKGHDLLLAALAGDAWRGRAWRLRLYGEGPDEGYLRALADHYRLTDRVEFRGHVRDIRAVWAENQVLVLPSRLEGTPLALVEAMLCGRPAVVTDVGGNAEWVEEGRAGFVAEGATPRSVAAALERAWSASAAWEEMGRRAHDVASRLIDPHPGRTVLNLLVEAVAARRAPAAPIANPRRVEASDV